MIRSPFLKWIITDGFIIAITLFEIELQAAGVETDGHIPIQECKWIFYEIINAAVHFLVF